MTSNDEIGYTGDTINEMTQGLMERDRIQQSLSLAKEIQQNLVPRKNVKINGLDMAGRSVYCDETGGDYYDFIPMAGNGDPKTGVAIGDVSGHGISSALLMATVRASLRQRASLPGGIAEMISDVNFQLAKDVEYSGDFMTLFFLVIDTLRGQLEWVRAGHDPAVIYTPETDSFQELKGAGMALGVKADWHYDVAISCRVCPGGRLFCLVRMVSGRHRTGKEFAWARIPSIRFSVSMPPRVLRTFFNLFSTVSRSFNKARKERTTSRRLSLRLKQQ